LKLLELGEYSARCCGNRDVIERTLYEVGRIYSYRSFGTRECKKNTET